MAWYWWLILIGVLIAVGFLKMRSIIKRKILTIVQKITRTIKTNFIKGNCCLYNSRERQI